MTQLARDFLSSIEGTNPTISTKELFGGARVYYIFNDVFGHALSSILHTQNLDVHYVRTAIRNSTGPRPSLFVPEGEFELLVKSQFKLFKGPSLRCVEFVYEELVKICHNCTSVVGFAFFFSSIFPLFSLSFHLCVAEMPVIAYVNSPGTPTFPLSPHPTSRSDLRAPLGETRTDIGVCTVFDRDTGCVYYTKYPAFISGSAAANNDDSLPPHSIQQLSLRTQGHFIHQFLLFDLRWCYLST
jgi:hypothetical protein